MQIKSLKRLYTVEVEFANGNSREVKTKATSREIAEQKALKFHPNAVGIKRG